MFRYILIFLIVWNIMGLFESIQKQNKQEFAINAGLLLINMLAYRFETNKLEDENKDDEVS